MVLVLFFCLLISVCAIVYPFKPLRSRATAALFALASLIGLGAISANEEGGIDKQQWRSAVQQSQRTIAELESKAASATDDAAKLKIFNQLVDLAPGNLKYLNAVAEIVARQRRADAIVYHPERLVRLSDVEWSKGGFGSVMVASFSVKNELPYDVKDVTVACTLSGPSGTEISRVRQTIYSTFIPGSVTRIDDLNMGFIHGQSASASCEVSNVVAMRRVP